VCDGAVEVAVAEVPVDPASCAERLAAAPAVESLARVHARLVVTAQLLVVGAVPAGLTSASLGVSFTLMGWASGAACWDQGRAAMLGAHAQAHRRIPCRWWSVLVRLPVNHRSRL
jgi:hypothetical protein